MAHPQCSRFCSPSIDDELESAKILEHRIAVSRFCRSSVVCTIKPLRDQNPMLLWCWICRLAPLHHGPMLTERNKQMKSRVLTSNQMMWIRDVIITVFMTLRNLLLIVWALCCPRVYQQIEFTMNDQWATTFRNDTINYSGCSLPKWKHSSNSAPMANGWRTSKQVGLD